MNQDAAHRILPGRSARPETVTAQHQHGMRNWPARSVGGAIGYATATKVRQAKSDVPRILMLGIDAGLTRTKAALFDAAGREVAAEGVSNEISRPFPGVAERSMDEAWKDAAKPIRGALAAASRAEPTSRRSA